MFVVEVIPLTLLPPNVPQILSYFSNSELHKGSIAEIPLNNRRVSAVVISSTSLEKEKLSLKKAGFQIKKINKVIYETPRVSDYQLKIAAWIAKYYHAPLGYTLKTILPPFALKNKYTLAEQSKISNKIETAINSVKPQVLIYKTKKLVDHLKPLIKEAAKKGKQVLIVVPEKIVIKYFVENLSEKFKTIAVFSGLPNKELYEAWKKALSGETELVIGTRQVLNMPFHNLGLIIVDDPNHEFYKSDMVPRYNAVNLAHKVAELNKADLVLTSVIPNVDTHHKVKGKIYELKNIEVRPNFETEIIDIAQEIKNGNWSPFSRKLGDELVNYLKDGKRVLIFSPRRGYAGILMCRNCGSAVKCPRCEVAMRTHRSVEMILTCHHCDLSRPLPNSCPVCKSYDLKTIGPVGTQKIYEEIRSRIISAGLQLPVLALDSDIVKNETEEEEIISEMQRSKPSVLIATQMVFSHRFYLNFDLIAVINADALINMPDFRSEENLFYQMEKLVNFLPKKLLVQTYNPENKVLEKAMRGDYADFYDNELKLREAFNYPPFYKIIKLTFQHKDKIKASYAARITTEKLKMAIARMRAGEEVKMIEATPAYIEKERGLYIYNIFLKVRQDYDNTNQLPAVSLSNLLKYVGSGWIIDVEPRSLL